MKSRFITSWGLALALTFVLNSCVKQQKFFSEEAEQRLTVFERGKQYLLRDPSNRTMKIEMVTYTHNEQRRTCSDCSDATEFEEWSFQYEMDINGSECNGSIKTNSLHSPYLFIDGGKRCELFDFIDMSGELSTKTIGGEVFTDVVENQEIDISLSRGIIRVNDFEYYNPAADTSRSIEDRGNL